MRKSLDTIVDIGELREHFDHAWRPDRQGDEDKPVADSGLRGVRFFR